VSLPVMQLKCGTSGNAVPTMLLKCGTQANAVPTLLRACATPSTNPCDYATILATLSGLTLCTCAELWAGCFAPTCYVLQNLSLSAMPVTAIKTGGGCCFQVNIGTVDLYSYDPTESPVCTTLTYVGSSPVVLFAYCYNGNPATNVVAAPDLSGYIDPILWTDGGLNGWTDWPNPNFGTFTRYISECGSYLTKGGSLTLEAP
jgi:hypothetical protein